MSSDPSSILAAWSRTPASDGYSAAFVYALLLALQRQGVSVRRSLVASYLVQQRNARGASWPVVGDDVDRLMANSESSRLPTLRRGQAMVGTDGPETIAASRHL